MPAEDVHLARATAQSHCQVKASSWGELDLQDSEALDKKIPVDIRNPCKELCFCGGMPCPVGGMVA